MHYRYKAEGMSALREKAGFKQIDASRATGISQTSLSRYESGRAMPTLMDALELADLYGLSKGDFINAITEPIAEEAPAA